VHDIDPRIVSRLERQNSALISLARSGVLQSGDLTAALRKILPVVVETLHVSRVSVWSFDEARTHIRCLDQHDLFPTPNIVGTSLQARDFPSYFNAIQNSDVIAADDAHTDPRTSEFTEVYLKPSGITSMMDVPVTGAGSRWGIVCHEHIGPARRWTSDEQSFALAVTNLICAVVEHAERKGLEARLRDYMDSATDCMTILSPDHRILFANQAWHTVTGYTREDLAAGMSPWKLVSPTHHPNLKEIESKLLRGETVRFTDIPGFTKDGRELIVDGSVRPKLSMGKLEYIYVVWHDATREKQNERYRSYFVDHSGAIFSLGFRKPMPISLPLEDQARWMAEHSYFAECNSATARIFGATRPEDLVGLSLTTLFPHAEDLRGSLMQWLQSGYRGENILTRAATRAGEDRWVLGSCHGILENGHLIRGWGMLVDVTARQKAESALRESEERFRQIAANIHEVFWLTEIPTWRVIYVSPAYAEMFGRKVADLLVDAWDWLKAVHPEDRDTLEANLKDPKSRQGFDYQYRIIKADGSVRWIHARGVSVKTGPGETPRMAGFVEDVTDLKDTEEALRESERRLSEALKKTEERVVQLEEQARDRQKVGRLIGKSPVMQEVYRRIRLAAESDATVLITGESGTGKELAASAIHTLGTRSDKPFIAVNCSAIPETLLESELFGHMKGAFTGAVRDKTGLLAAAEGGTLFLDEVADMSPILQVKLLRVLQEREYRRVGDEKPLRCNVRIVTATNRNMTRLLSTGALREDFYFRIRVFTIEMPPLHWRREDIPLLVSHLVEELSRTTGHRVTGVTEDALRALMDHPWPGNVRELRNAIEGAFVTVRGNRLSLADLPLEVRQREHRGNSGSSPEQAEERVQIEAALREADGNRTKAAAALGISRVTLWKKMRRLGIED
jgi:two-component system, NtrC family, response regulator HydG